MGYRSNIIDVDVSGNSEVTIERGIYQYDHGMKLKINGIETSDTIEVHYAFKGMRDVMTDTPTKDGSAFISSIPDEVLAQPMPINAYVYQVKDGAGYTIHVIHICLEPRPGSLA